MNIELKSRDIKNGHKSLYLEYYEKGTRKYESLRLYLLPPVSEEARLRNESTMRKAQEIKSQRVINPATKPEKAATTHRETELLLLDWIDRYVENLRSSNYSKAVINQNRRLKEIIFEWLTYLGRPALAVSKVDKRLLRSFLKYLAEVYVSAKHKTAQRLSPNTLMMYQAGLVTILNRAVKEQIIPRNPFYELGKDERFKRVPVQREYLTRDELKRFMATETDNRHVQRAFVFACFTGLRISDIRQLRWEHLQLDTERPFLRIEMAKTRRLLTVPLGRKALEWLPEKTEKYSDNVFPLPTRTAVFNDLKHVARLAGIEKDISFHTSRHTFATMTLAACGSIETVKALLGHRSIKSTMVYAEVLNEAKQEAVNAVNGLF